MTTKTIPSIHDWFARGVSPPDPDPLNAKIYAELFLTPDSDPGLGLLPRNTFTALENNGIVRIQPSAPNPTP